MEEVKKVQEKVQVKKSRKWLIIPLGILGIFLVCSAVLVGLGFLASKYIPEVEEYISNHFNSSDKIDSSKIVLSGDEVNIINIVEETSPSVVSIAISKLALSQGEGVVDQSSNIGTGFIVNSDGVIITNQHVVSDTTAEYKIVTKDGDEFAVSEILRDDINDLALLKVDPAGKTLKAIELGNSDNLLVGQTVIAIGTPLGEYAGSVTSGIISGLNRSVTTSASWFGTTSKTYEGVIQTDAAVNPGNSGGPLINSQGEVIGINFATTSGADNISFAIPINKIKSRIDEYRTYGKFIKPYFGVTYQMISEYEALYYSDVVAGALVVRIDPLAPAYSAGLRRGDIVTEFGGEKLSSSLGELIQKHKVGEEVEVKVYRTGEEKSFKVTLAEMD
ncbi:trypsin-like serine protease [Candidatus Microgenomates bacterium]|nr:trypsin-like serine protease [Candidatus Microgenomates bacterium]